jgi:hypothetical protein
MNIDYMDINKIPSVMSFGGFLLIAKIPNLFIHIIYMT